MPVFEARFSGLCGFVPNRIDSSEATSWSALLYNLETPFSVPDTPISVSPHFPVLVYRTDHFKVLTGKPRMKICDCDTGTQLGVIRLEGKRVEFTLPGAQPFSCDVREPENPAGGPKNEEEFKRAYWIPELEKLLPGGGTLVDNGKVKLFNDDGFPNNTNLSAHVLLMNGTLQTKLLASPGQAGYCNIWKFNQQTSERQTRHTQAVAYQTSLIAETNEHGIRIKIHDFWENVIELEQRSSVDNAHVRIENYEFEEIVQWARGLPTKDLVDSDFELMNYLADLAHRDERCVPKYDSTVELPWVDVDVEEGVGTLRRTCGGARFKNFPADYQDILTKWNLPQPPADDE
ncbi:MAG: hypothetical protein AAGM22_17580 [Acidobacteriota bacterium]